MIQALTMLYLARQEIHAFLDDNFSKDRLTAGLAAFTDKFAENDLPALSEIEKIPVKEFRVDVPFANWRWVNTTITADTPRTKIPSKLHVGDKEYNCTIRVSFGGSRHWMGDRKSVRLRFSDNELYDGGIRELNLNIPETHKVIIEGIAWEFAKIMGLPTPEFDFVNLYINNQYEGLRLLYEDADGYFLQRNNLMGYIFTEKRHSFPFHYESANDSDYPHAKVINKKYGTLDEIRYLNKILSYPSYEQFKEQVVKLVDLPQVARWYAHSLICGSGHQNTHNVKLFYNAALQKFQWLPWDIAGFGHWGGWPGSTRQTWAMDLDWATNNFTYHLNLIPEFVEERNRILWHYLNDALSLKNQLAIVDKYYKKVRYHLYADNFRQASEHRFEIGDFEKAIVELREWIQKRHQYMLNALQTANLRVSQSELNKSAENIAGNGVTKATDGVVLSLGTGGQAGVNLHKIILPAGSQKINPEKVKIYLDANANNALDRSDREIAIIARHTVMENGNKTIALTIDETLLPARKTYRDKFFDYEDKGYVLQPRPFHRYYNYLVIYESESTNGDTKPVFSNHLKVECRNSITGAAVSPEYFLDDPEKSFALVYKEGNTHAGVSFSMLTNGKSSHDNAGDEQVLLSDYLKQLGSGKEKNIPAGKYLLAENLRIQPDEKVSLSAGVQLAIMPGVSILVRGELNAEGRADKPVVFENALPGQAWGCLAYYKTDKISHLRNAVIRYGGMAKIDSVSFTGSVSAYYATIVIDSCSFEEIQADDGLNIKYSNTRTLNSRFIAPKDDAIDYDFSEGEIRNSYFYKSGGDAIDFGTANPLVSGNVVEFAGDKGISVGENSSPTIEHNVLFGGQYGIAIKDDSSPIIRNNTIVGNNIGLSFYIKKPDEFGCPTAQVSRIILWDNKKEIENLCEAQFTITESVVEGGFSGENIYTQRPDLVPNDRGHKTILRTGSFYEQKDIGAQWLDK
jgi:parallel beta-helix repeat protein